MIRLPQLSAVGEQEMRSLYKTLGISDVVTEAAIKVGRGRSVNTQKPRAKPGKPHKTGQRRG
jgi:hypothetical protein